MSDSNDITGTWHCRYWYENTRHNGRLDTSDYEVAIERKGGDYCFHSLENSGALAGSHIEGRLGVDGTVVSGIWREDTAPAGEWGGMTYTLKTQLSERFSSLPQYGGTSQSITNQAGRRSRLH